MQCSDAAAPIYPAVLRTSRIGGRVIARFVVDTLGRPELDEMVLFDASHPCLRRPFATRSGGIASRRAKWPAARCAR